MGVFEWKDLEIDADGKLRLSVSNFNALANMVQGLARSMLTNAVVTSSGIYGRPQHHEIVEIWPAFITSTGPDSGDGDYADCRYWVKRVRDEATTGDKDAQPVVTEHVATVPRARHVTATNLAEYVDDSHALATDETVYVVVMTFHDRSDPPVIRHYFVPGGAAGTGVSWGKIKTAQSGNVVVANPCDDEAGGNPDVHTDVNIYVVTPIGKTPTTVDLEVNDVVAYFDFGSGTDRFGILINPPWAYALLDAKEHNDTVASGSAKGSIIVGNDGTPSKWKRFGVGTDGRMMFADASAADGLAWSTGTRLARKGFYLNADNEVINDWLRIHG